MKHALTDNTIVKRPPERLIAPARALARLLSILLLLMVVFRPVAHAEAIVVVVGGDTPVDDVSRKDLASIYLKKRHDMPYTPLDREEDELRKAFYAAIAGMSLNRVRAYWSKRVFTGRGRPPESISDGEVSDAMARTPNGMTYMFASEVPPGSRIVYRLSGESP